MTNPDETVVLKSGDTMPLGLVTQVGVSLQLLMDGGIPGVTQLYDVVMMARPGGYEPDAANRAAIEDLGFIDASTGGLHRSIATIVRNSVEGESFNMCLVSPVPEASS